MRLVGGNIGDAPVKNVRDGSAFAAAGGGGAPDLAEIGTVPTAGTQITAMATGMYQGSVGARASSTVKWSDNSFGLFYHAYGGGTARYHHIQTNADGTFLSCGTVQGLSEFTETPSTGNPGVIIAKKMGASKVLLYYVYKTGSNHRCQLMMYDKSGDTLVADGAVLDISGTGGSGLEFQNSYFCPATTTQGYVTEGEPSYPAKIRATPYNKSTGNIGTTVQYNIAYSDSAGGNSFTDNTKQIYMITGRDHAQDGNTLRETTLTEGTTPQMGTSVTATNYRKALGSAYGNSDHQSEAGLDNGGGGTAGGGIAVSLINKNTPTRGMFMATLMNTTSNAGHIVVWNGPVLDASDIINVVPFGVLGTDFGTDTGRDSSIIEVSYDADTYWGKYVYQNATTLGGIFYMPFNYNWDTYERTVSQAVNLPKWTTAASVSVYRYNHVFTTIMGSATATNLVTIYTEDRDSADNRYLNIPIEV